MTAQPNMAKLSNVKVKKAKKIPKAVSDKAKRKRLEIVCDDLWKALCRKWWGGVCAWPGCQVTKPLYCHHFFHKAQGNRARWEQFNSILLCYGHHMGQVHRAGNVEPIRDVLIGRIGQIGFDVLRVRCGLVFKPTLEDLELLRDELANKLERGEL
jgi:hypothetical protein